MWDFQNHYLWLFISFFHHSFVVQGRCVPFLTASTTGNIVPNMAQQITRVVMKWSFNWRYGTLLYVTRGSDSITCQDRALLFLGNVLAPAPNTGNPYPKFATLIASLHV